MNPRIAWIQPEQFGPATELWQRLWEQSKECDDEETPLDGIQNAEMHKKAINPYLQISGTFLRPFYWKTHPSKNPEYLFSFLKNRVVT